MVAVAAVCGHPVGYSFKAEVSGLARELIDKEKVYQRACAGCTRHGEAPMECYHDEPCERLIFEFTTAEPVNAVELPCKIGDEVWGLKLYRDARIPKKGVVHQMYFGEDMTLCICVKKVCRGQWGRNIFATREEAEAAIGGGSIHV